MAGATKTPRAGSKSTLKTATQMGVIFRMALRNLTQHKSKTIIIGLFISVGVMIVELGNGFLEATNRGMERDFRANYTADLVISAPVPKGAVDMDMFSVESLTLSRDSIQVPALPDLAATEAVVKAHGNIAETARFITSQGVMMSGKLAEFEITDDTNFSSLPMFLMFSGEDPDYYDIFPSIKVIEGRRPAPGTTELLVDTDLRASFEDFFKEPLNVGDTVLIAGISTRTTLREATVCGFYDKPNPNTTMLSVVYADPSFARIYANLTYSASFESMVPEGLEVIHSSVTEDELFGGFDSSDFDGSDFDENSFDSTGTDFWDADFGAGEDDLFGGDSEFDFDDSAFDFDDGGVLLASGDIDYNAILGDTTLRDKLNMADEGAWQFIVCRLDNTGKDAVERTKTELSATFAEQGIPARVMDWRQAAKSMSETVDGISVIFTALIIILAVVVFIIIMNTMTISVLERTGEIGTMRALGSNKDIIRKLFVTESLTITVFSATLGTVVALIIMAVVNGMHITITNTVAKMLLGGGSINLIPTAKAILSTVLLITLGSLLANLYPVSAALKVTPLKALSKGDD